jgi:hypothetical protein
MGTAADTSATQEQPLNHTCPLHAVEFTSQFVWAEADTNGTASTRSERAVVTILLAGTGLQRA